MPAKSLFKPKPQSCAGCPWEHTTLGYATPSGDPATAKFFVIGESAGENEAIQGEPFVGWSGSQLRSDLQTVGIKRSEIYIDNIIRCQPVPGAKKNSTKIPAAVTAFCTKQNIGPVLAANPDKYILAVGEYSLKYLTGRTKITKQRGSLLSGPHGHRVIPTVHYAAIAHSPKLKTLRPFIRFDVQKLAELATDPIKEAEYFDRAKENFNINPTIEEIALAFAEIKQVGRVSVDIEHAGGQFWSALLLCIGFYYSGKGINIPLHGYRGGNVWSSEELEQIILLLDSVLSDPSIVKIFQNGNSDRLVLESTGFTLCGFSEDSMIKHKTVFNESGVPHNLGFIGSVHGATPFSKDDAKGSETFALIEPDRLRTYNLRDVKITYDSSDDLDWYLDDRKVRRIYQQDMILNSIIYKMMKRGMILDRVAKDHYRQELLEEVADIDSDLREILGSNFNPQSSKHLRLLFYSTLGLQPQGFTKTGEDKTDFDTLISLQDSLSEDSATRRLFDLLMLRSKNMKLASTYLKDFYTDPSGALHTTINIHIVPSGRFSSSDPNLQNIPRQAAEGAKIKRLFRARPGFYFLTRDYSQIEFVIYINAANDLALIAAQLAGQDFHTLSARDLFQTTTITKDQRDFAKTFHYGGILYGGGADAIRRQAIRALLRAGRREVEVPTASKIETLQTNWFSKHPNAAAYNDHISAGIRASRQVETLISKRPRFFIRNLADSIRSGRSHVISGTAADVINEAMIALDPLIEPPNGMVMQIHDELIFEVQKFELQKYIELTKLHMERTYQIGTHMVKFKTEAKYGEVWGELQPIKE